MSIRCAVLPLVFLLACSRPPAAPPADAATSAAPPATVPTGPAAVPSAAATMPTGDVGPPGPIRVEGYSRITHTGMNDPAYAAGFSTDGEYFGYCTEIGARAEPSTTCRFLAKDGQQLTLSSDVKDFFDAASKRRLDAWVKEHGIPRQPTPQMGKASARELTGTWAFARDLTLVLDEHAQGKRGAAVRVGGRVGNEAPVFPVLLDRPSPGESPHHVSWVESFALSPDARELGLVAGFFCMEWCDDFEVRRFPVARLAAQIFNDTAMRHHSAKDYAGSALLFEKATQADPTFALAAYNLACAYARLRDAKAQTALERAVGLDPSARARAQKDPDFDAVRTEAWFPR